MTSKVHLLRARHQIFREVRAFFEDLGFTEIHTPLLVPNPGLEPYLIPFETRFEPGLGGGQAQNLYLPTSPEYHLKKALSLGFERIFEITRSFRNGELTREHEPEFFMLEWYRHPGSYQDIAKDFQGLLAHLGQRFAPQEPWAKPQTLSVCEAFQKWAHMDLEGCLLGHAPSLSIQAQSLGLLSVTPSDDFETAFNKILVEKIEPRLGDEGPLFLWDYPASMSALARVKPEAPHLCERFEVYWKGIELANAFGELTDAHEQRRRCEADIAQRLELYGKSPPLDEAFLASLSALKHPAGGIAVGLDRLVQCLLEQKQVQQVIAFPHRVSI